MHLGRKDLTVASEPRLEFHPMLSVEDLDAAIGFFRALKDAIRRSKPRRSTAASSRDR